VLLLIALVAIMFSCLLLVIEMAKYGFQWKPPANLGSAAPATAADVLLA
jgi:hypothetical protein